jgi:hypothetical protein
MPKTGKEADINCHNATVCRWCGSEREVAELRINVYAHDLQEMCET